MPNEDVTTKFKVDISELKKEMQEAKRATQLANSEFKLAASECDNWQQSSNALSAKLKALNSTLNEQKAKLALLEAEYNSLTDEQKQGSAAAQKLLKDINNQKAAINNTEREISGFEDSLKEVTKAERVAAATGKDVSEVLDDMSDKAKGAEGGFTVLKGALANLLANGVTAAINGLKELGQAAIDVYKTYDEGADTVIAKTGATGKAAQELSANYKNVSKSIVGDFSDIGTAVGEVSTRFGVTGKDLENLSTKFLKFAELNGTDVNGSIDTVQKSLSAFGLETSEAGSVLDTLNKVGQDTGISMDSLSTLLVENASSFSQMGLDIHQAASFLGEIEKSGVTTSVAMTSLSKASQYAAEANKPLTTVLEETNTKMKNAKTDTEGLQIAYDVFGKKAGAKIYEACKTGSLSFAELSKAMQDNSGSIDETYESTQDGMDKIKLAVQGAKAEVSDKIASFLDEHKESIVGFIEDVKDGFQWVMDNGSTIISVLAGIGAGFVAFKVASLINGVVTAMQAYKAANEGATIAQQLFNGALKANPMMLIVSLVATLVTAIVTFIATNDEARAKFTEIWQGVKDFFEGVWNGIVTFFTETIPNAFKSVIDWVKENFDLLLTFLINPFAGLFKYFYENNTKFKEFVDNAVKFIKELPSKIWTWLLNTIEKVKNWAKDMIAKAKDTGKEFIDKVLIFIKDLPSKVWEFLSNVIEKVKNWGSDLAAKGKQAAKDLFNAVKDKVQELPEKIKNIGKDLVEGLWTGISDKVEWIKNKLVGFKDAVLNKLKDVFDINSPSKLMRDEIGRSIVEGIIAGVDAETGNAEKSAEELAQLYVDAAKNKVTALKEANEIAELEEIYFWENVQSYCANGTEAYKTATEEIANAKKALNDAVKDRTSDILSGMNLFEAVEVGGVITSSDLLGNLNSQLDALKQYDSVLSALEKRTGVKESGLYDELAKMGVGDLATLTSLNAMNDTQLGEFIRLYSEKQRIAEDRAKREFGIIEDASTNELLEMADALKAEAESVGASIIDGIKNGIHSKIASLETELQALRSSLSGLIGADSIAGLSGSLGGLKASLVSSGVIGGNSVVNNFTQVINSPTAPNRLDIYRNTKNLLNYKGGK